MTTTSQGGTPDASVRCRPQDRGRLWPASVPLAGVLLGLTLLVARCSSGPAASRASGGGTTADSAVTDPLVLKADQDLVNFARCMRALAACRHLLPVGITDDGTGP